MPSYRYLAYNSRGELLKDVITASSKEQALHELQYAGLMVESMTTSLSANIGRAGLPSKELYAVIKQLCSLLAAGIPVAESVSILARKESKSSSKHYFSSIYDFLVKGYSFSDACAQFPETFDEVFLSLVKTGEQSGDLPGVLSQYQKYLSMRLEMAASFKQALAYPVFLLVTLTAVLAILLIYVVPNFTGLFDSFGAELPLATQVVVSLSKGAPVGFLFLAALGVLLVVLKKSYEPPVSWIILADKYSRRIPAYGTMRVQNQSARLMRMLNSLLASGSPLLSSLKSTREIFSKTYLGCEIEVIIKQLESGTSLSQALETVNFLPEYAKEMLAVGERSSALVEMMSEVATYCEESFESKLKYVSTLVEPVLMLALGILVGGIIVAMYLPIFYLADVVQ